MNDSEIYMELLKKVEKNKYILMQKIIEKGEMLSKINPDYIPFYSEDCLKKVTKEMLREAEEKK